MKSARPPTRWRLLTNMHRRSPEWLAANYEKTLFKAAAYAFSSRGRFPEPLRSLLASIDVELLSPIFNKAVVSFHAPPFRGGLHNTYSWPHIACSNYRELGREIVADLKSFIQLRSRERAALVLAELHTKGSNVPAV